MNDKKLAEAVVQMCISIGFCIDSFLYEGNTEDLQIYQNRDSGMCAFLWMLQNF